MPEFTYTDVLPLGADDTPYRCITTEGVRTVEAAGRTFLEVDPEAIRLITAEAMHDIAHLLRPGHLAQLAKILDDPEASANDRFVALDLLQNANIAASGILPMCQDTGTAIVKGKRGQNVLTQGHDEAAIARGVFDAYTNLNLRYSQMAPLSMWEEVNTKTNLPAEIKISAIDGDAYKFLFMAKGGGSANKSYLYQETKAVLNPTSLLKFLDEKLRTLGTAACPPYHLGVVIGGTSAEFALETAKLASTRYLDTLPTSGSALGHGFRDVDFEAEVLALSQAFGIGAQFGGKYFCHDVRVIRLPRHGASLPIAVAVSCSADRQALGKITSEGVFLEQLETDPAKYLPEVTDEHLSDDVIHVDLGRPMSEIRSELGNYRQARRTARRRRRAPRLSQGPSRLLRRAGKDPGGIRIRVVRADHGRSHGLIRRPLPGRGRFTRDGREGQPLPSGHRRVPAARRLLPGLGRRSRGTPRQGLHPLGRSTRIRRAWHGSDLEDRSRELPSVRDRRRQRQRFLRRGLPAGRHPSLMTTGVLASSSTPYFSRRR